MKTISVVPLKPEIVPTGMLPMNVPNPVLRLMINNCPVLLAPNNAGSVGVGPGVGVGVGVAVGLGVGVGVPLGPAQLLSETLSVYGV